MPDYCEICDSKIAKYRVQCADGTSKEVCGTSCAKHALAKQRAVHEQMVRRIKDQEDWTIEHMKKLYPQSPTLYPS